MSKNALNLDDTVVKGLHVARIKIRTGRRAKDNAYIHFLGGGLGVYTALDSIALETRTTWSSTITFEL